MHLAEESAGWWRELARRLDSKMFKLYGRISKIEQTYPNKLELQAAAMLEEWRTSRHGTTTTDLENVLIQTLREMGKTLVAVNVFGQATVGTSV